MTLLGQLEHGFYIDPCDTMSQQEINIFHGFDEDGEPDSDDDDDDDEGSNDSEEDSSEFGSESDSNHDSDASSDDRQEGFNISEVSLTLVIPIPTYIYVLQVIDSNIRHDSVPVPRKACPFNDSQLELFKAGFVLIQNSGDIPLGYGVTPSEWDETGYPTTEVMTVGLRKNSFPISLPDGVWRPRAESWVRALYVMDTILYSTTASDHEL